MEKRTHSIPVPRLYKEASKMYRESKETSRSLKNLIYEVKHPNKKAIYALVLTVAQNEEVLEHIIKKSSLLEKEPGLPSPMAKVLIAELLWGKRRLVSESKPIQTILAYQQILEAHASDAKFDKAAIGKVQQVYQPRFVRVNTLKISMSDAIDAFRQEGWILKKYLGNDYAEFLAVVNGLGEMDFMVDMHVDELLIFAPRTEFFKHEAYRSGKIVLQDKASCLPVTLLNPPPGSEVLDMCAAPGMKTTQLAAQMNNEGKIYAVELDDRRVEVLKTIVEKAGATCVEILFKDVLSIDGEILPNVEYVLVDPSCSGSGIINRPKLDQNDMTQERINKLAGFQIMALKHAMRFPKVKRIVYSTCSLLPQENEEIVREALQGNPYFKLLDARKLLPTWKNFGSDEYEVGKYCVYCRPEEDLTNGFFVAVMERIQGDEVNEFLSEDIMKSKKKLGKQKLLKMSVTGLLKSMGIEEDDEDNKGADVVREKKRKIKVENSESVENIIEDVKQKKKNKKKTQEVSHDPEIVTSMKCDVLECYDPEIVLNIPMKCEDKDDEDDKDEDVVKEKKRKKKVKNSESAETENIEDVKQMKKKKKKKQEVSHDPKIVTAVKCEVLEVTSEEPKKKKKHKCLEDANASDKPSKKHKKNK